VPFLLASKVVTIPEFLAQRYGPAVRQTFAFVTVIANVVIFMAAVLYTGGLPCTASSAGRCRPASF